MSPPLKRWLVRLGRGALGLLLLLAVIELFGDMQDARQLLALDWFRSWPVLLWTLLINLIATWRWRVLVRLLSGVDVPFVSLFKSVVVGRLVGNATSQLLGDMGTRSVYLKSQGVGFRQGGVSLVADKLFEVLLAGVVWLAFLAWFLAGLSGRWPLAELGSVLLLFGLAIGSLPWLARLVMRWWPAGQSWLAAPFLFDSTRWLLAGLSLAKYVSVTLRFLFILTFCGIDTLDFAEAFFGTAWAQLGLMVGLTPGGLGFVEAGWSGALYYYGVSAALVPKFLIAQRLLIVASVVLLVPLVLALDTVFGKVLVKPSEV